MPSQPDSIDSLSDVRIQEILQVFEYKADNHMLRSIRAYALLLLRWNRRVSLTAITDPEDILSRHFGESLLAQRVLDFSHGFLADIGSGAGFPAFPLKLANPALRVRLFEANKKKCAFLSEVVRELELQEVEIITSRTDEFHSSPFATVVTARAVGDYGAMLRWASTILLPAGRVVLWLGQKDASSLSSQPGWKWQDPVPVPRSGSRVILAGELAET